MMRGGDNMYVHEVKVHGSRFLVFNVDDYESGSGMYDCVLITDDFEEAEKLAIEISYNLYYPSSASVFDVKNKKYYSYINGKIHERHSESIKFT